MAVPERERAAHDSHRARVLGRVAGQGGERQHADDIDERVGAHSGKYLDIGHDRANHGTRSRITRQARHEDVRVRVQITRIQMMQVNEAV